MQDLVKLESAEVPPGSDATLGQLRRAALLTGVVGTVFSILFLSSLWILNQLPRPKDEDQVYIDFYSSNDRQEIALVGLYLLPFAAVAFIWFIAALRQWVSISPRRGSQLLGTVQLLSGVAFITLTLVSAAASTMPAAVTELTNEVISPDLARDFPLFGNALLLVFGVRVAAIFVTATTNIAFSSGLMPRWFHLISFAVAIVLFLSASLSFWLVVIFPLWVLALGVLIILRAYRFDRNSPLANLLIPIDRHDARQADGAIGVGN